MALRVVLIVTLRNSLEYLENFRIMSTNAVFSLGYLIVISITNLNTVQNSKTLDVSFNSDMIKQPKTIKNINTIQKRKQAGTLAIARMYI